MHQSSIFVGSLPEEFQNSQMEASTQTVFPLKQLEQIRQQHQKTVAALQTEITRLKLGEDASKSAAATGAMSEARVCVEAPRLDWLLARNGPQQLSIPPECCALTLNQLREFTTAVYATERYAELKLAPQTAWSDAGSVNLYQINNNFIIPWTANTGSCVALHANPNGLKAEAMISHVTCLALLLHIMFT